MIMETQRYWKQFCHFHTNYQSEWINERHVVDIISMFFTYTYVLNMVIALWFKLRWWETKKKRSRLRYSCALTTVGYFETKRPTFYTQLMPTNFSKIWRLLSYSSWYWQQVYWILQYHTGIESPKMRGKCFNPKLGEKYFLFWNNFLIGCKWKV